MAQDVWTNPKLWRLLLRSLHQLKRIVEEAHDRHDESARELKVIEIVFPYRHANNLCWLADDLRLLIRNRCIGSPPVIARAMLESFFYLAACKAVPNFAARKSIWEMREFLRRTSNFALDINVDNEMAAERAKIHAFIERIERHYSLTANERPWTIARCIEACGDVAFLKANYFFLSQHTHASFLGLSARHDDRHSSLVQQAVLGSLIIGGWGCGSSSAERFAPAACGQGNIANA